MEHWYVLFTKPREESRAQCNLETQGLKTYLPMISVNKKKSGPFCQKEPMFPRYLFVAADEQIIDFISIQYTRGVVDFVRFGNVPATMDKDVIESVKNNEKIINSTFEFSNKENQRAVSRHPLSEVDDAIFDKKGDERVIVLLSALQDSYTLESGVRNIY